MGQGYNKLVEGAKARKEVLKNKLRFVIKSLTDTDARAILFAYNEMKNYYYDFQISDYTTGKWKKRQ